MQSFIFSSHSISIKDTVVSPSINSVDVRVLPGKYYLIHSDNVYSYPDAKKTNEIFLLHESMVENKPNLESLSSLNWIDNHYTFDYVSTIDHSVAMIGHISDDIRYTSELLEEHELNGNIVTVLDEGILFNFLYNDFGILYSVIQDNGCVKGFKLETDSLENKYNRQFEEFCLRGNLEHLKELITNKKDYINVYYKKGNSFYNACKEGQKNIIEYLLFSKELKENVVIKNIQGISSGFLRLCNQHMDIMESLILEHDLKRNSFINELLDLYSDRENFKIIKNLFNAQEMKTKLDNELNKETNQVQYLLKRKL